MKNFRALVNGQHIVESDTIKGLKRAASIQANNTYNTVDTLQITYIHGDPVGEYPYHRINKKFPNNTMIRGEWR